MTQNLDLTKEETKQITVRNLISNNKQIVIQLQTGLISLTFTMEQYEQILKQIPYEHIKS